MKKQHGSVAVGWHFPSKVHNRWFFKKWNSSLQDSFQYTRYNLTLIMKVFTWLPWIQTKWQANQRNLECYKQKQPKEKSSVFGMSVLNLSISKQMCNSNLFWREGKTLLSLVSQNALVISLLWYPHLVLTIHIVHLDQFTATWFSSNWTPINHKLTVYLL